MSSEYFKNFLSNLQTSPESSCSYFHGRKTASTAFTCSEDLSSDAFNTILSLGFRRCGDYFYKVNCPSCADCISYRLPVEKFISSRSQKRVLKKNLDIRLKILDSPKPDAVKEIIYLRYQYKQHYSKPASDIAQEEFSAAKEINTMYTQMYTNLSNAREIELYLDDDLIGFGILDLAQGSISAVYTVYDPDLFSRSLGTYFILQIIEYTKQLKLPYLYLGFYIADHKKMDYKKNFQPAEILIPGSNQWIDFKDEK